MKTLLFTLQFCVTIRISHLAYINNRKTSIEETKQSLYECPNYCICDKIRKGAVCTAYYKGFLLKDIPRDYTIISLTLFGEMDAIPNEILASLGGLKNLDLSRNSIQEMTIFNLKNPNLLNLLDLSSNDITFISSTAFDELQSLQDLSLSENKIEELSATLFQNLTKLKRLNLSFNRISGLSDGIFDQLKMLEELNLRNNQLHWIAGDIFQNLIRLKSINLSDNKLWTIPKQWLPLFGKLEHVSLFGNRLDCSCEITGFLEYLKTNRNTTANKELLTCSHPKSLKDTRILNLSNKDLKCDEPLIGDISASRVAIIGSEISLYCHTETHGAGYWVTSKGAKVASKYHIQYLLKLNITAIPEIDYKSSRSSELSYITVSENNTLTIKNFVNGLQGKYFCNFISENGNDTSSVVLESMTKLFEIQWMCVFFGVVCAGSVLLLSIFIGTIKMCAVHICKCDCAQPQLKKTHPKSQCDEATKPNSLIVSTENSDDEYSDADPLLRDANVADDRNSSHDGETATATSGVKTKLGKKIKKVRSQVILFRETVKDTSSQAASKVKAGVVMGVEQVKFGVMSMKEFCGAGEIAQTVSIMSVNTDVDSEKTSTHISKVTTF